MPPKGKKRGPYKKKDKTVPKSSASAKSASSLKIGSNISNDILSVKSHSNDPFPERYKCTLKYSDNFNIATGVSGLVGGEYIWRVNSIFDPDYTNVGHQPYGRDQLALLYANYIVTGFEYEVLFTDPNGDGVMCFVSAMQAATLTGLTALAAMEKPRTQFALVSNTGEQNIRFKGYMKPWKAISIKKSQYMDDTTQSGAIFGQNPAIAFQGYLRASCANVNPALAAQNINLVISLKYHVTCYNRITQTVS